MRAVRSGESESEGACKAKQRNEGRNNERKKGKKGRKGDSREKDGGGSPFMAEAFSIRHFIHLPARPTGHKIFGLLPQTARPRHSQHAMPVLKIDQPTCPARQSRRSGGAWHACPRCPPNELNSTIPSKLSQLGPRTKLIWQKLVSALTVPVLIHQI